MKLNPGITIEAPVLCSGEMSPQHYRVKILDLLHQGEHFNIYRAEDSTGTYVCLKTIRYCSKKQNIFASARDYVERRRAALNEEHRMLSYSHPSLPEPLAMLIVSNDSKEDAHFETDIADWQDVRHREPILVQEAFSGQPLNQLTDKIRKFNIERRVSIVRKVAKVCLHVHKHGYLLQGLHLNHILLTPRYDDNIHLVGLHNVCALNNGKANTPNLPLHNITTGFAPREAYEQGLNRDFRIDVFAVGMLFYYLLTLRDPLRDRKKKKSGKIEIAKYRQRLEKAIRSLKPSAMWLANLIMNLIEPRPEYRIPDIDSFLQYLSHPPKDKVYFTIDSASATDTNIRINNIPKWTKSLKIRMEIVGGDKIVEKECAAKSNLALPGVGAGTLVCSMAAISMKQKLSWWTFEETMVAPEIKLEQLENLPADKFGFTWEPLLNLRYVSFRVLDKKGRITPLGKFTQNRVELPPDNISLPMYEPLHVECIGYFGSPSGLREKMLHSQPLQLFPPIPTPVFRQSANGIELEMVISRQQLQTYAEIEVLHNNWPCEPSDRNTYQDPHQQQKIVFSFAWHKVDLFEEQQFSFRVLLNTVGWRTGPSVTGNIHPPNIDSLDVAEEEASLLQLSWPPISHPQLDCYEIHCDTKLIERTTVPSYLLRIPLADVAPKNNLQISISIICIYKDGAVEKKSAPYTHKYTIKEFKNLFQYSCEHQVTPFFTRFRILFENLEAFSKKSATLLFQRQKRGQEHIEALQEMALQQEIICSDNTVEPETSYRYFLSLKESALCLLEQTVKTPKLNIQGVLKHVGYEECTWEILIDADAIGGDTKQLEIIRTGKEQQSLFLDWHAKENKYCFSDAQLLPGTTYCYSLLVPLGNQASHQVALGEVTTKEFAIQESTQVTYHSAVITWNPSPADEIDCIEIYGEGDRVIGTTRSDSITLENLEPEKTHSFPLKYRYLSGRIVDGPVVSFTTLPYKVHVEASDINIDSFRLRWELNDLGVQRKIKELFLEGEANIGTHKFRPNIRSIQLRQLYPATTYKWSLKAIFRSGSSCVLSQGETTTASPDFDSDVEIGLVHHICWQYSPCFAIEKIEVHRENVPLIQTSENEFYDSDFKGGKEICYQFYYLLKDGRRLLAGEKKVQSLSMADLFSALTIEPGIGEIYWDFEELKQIKYLKYLELFRDGNSVYKQGSHVDSLVYTDSGEKLVHSDKYSGLPNKPMNFQLAVVGVAPSKRKCKKKWVLNIKGLQCHYPEQPSGFCIIPENSRIYFSWEFTPTDILREIIIRRADDVVIYQGPNQENLVYDDNQGAGLEPKAKYQYYMEMVYNKHIASGSFEVDLANAFDPSRLELECTIEKNRMLISWNRELDSSITHIGCRADKWWMGKSFFPKQLFGNAKWTEFSVGELRLAVSSKSRFRYQCVFKDCYGRMFSAPAQIYPEE